jgi:Transposase DDE domain
MRKKGEKRAKKETTGKSSEKIGQSKTTIFGETSMSISMNDTDPQTAWQEGEEWNAVLEPLLPAQWREQAQQLGAWQRVRKIKDPGNLLRGLLLYAACSCSFRVLGIWASLQGIGSLSERAWRKRLVRSAAWIKWLLAALLAERIGMPLPVAGKGRVLLVDATHLAVLAGHGDDLKLHCAYDVCQANLSQVRVTDRHVSEQLRHLSLQAGDIVVTDAGYVAARSVEYAREQEAFVLQRFSARHVRLLEENGQLILLKERIESQAYGTWSRHPCWLLLPQSLQRVAVRVVAFRLPEAQAVQAMERKAKRLRSQYGKGYSREAVWWAQWCLLLTTLPQNDWDEQGLLDLYRARWQIELLFKRFKQSQQRHRLPFRDEQRAEMVVHLHLIVWVLQEHLASQLQAAWPWEEEEERLEPEEEPEVIWPPSRDQTPRSVAPADNQMLLLQVCLTQVQQMLRGSCPQWRLLAAWPSLHRYWSGQRRRRNHGPIIQEWVSARLVAISGP